MSENLFLKTKEKNYYYEDLASFSTYFIKKIEPYTIQGNRPIGLYGLPSEEIIFIIASCWILNVPFIVFNHHLPGRKTKQQIQKLKPGVVITDQPEKAAGRETLSLNFFNLDDILGMSQNHDPSFFADTSDQLISNSTDIFGYFFTSGTSSAPKVVPLKRRQMISGAQSSAKNILPSPNECWLLCMPLFHIGGISIILRSLLYGSAIFHVPKFEEDETAHLLSADDSIVAVSLVPTMLKRLLENEEFNVNSNLKAVLLGGSPVSNSLIEESIERGIPIITSYGMTETCAQIAANPLFKASDGKERWHSAGQLFEPNRIEIRNQQNQPVPVGTSGTIRLKGPQIFDGYLEKNVDEIDDSHWFNTGDFGRLDDEGRLFIEARRTDLIITGGENVSPKEVEEMIASHESVEEAAVFGVPDEEWGEQVTAAVIARPAVKVDLQEVKEYLKGELAPYKIPKQFLLVEELPRTYNGKIQRYKLKDLLQSRP